MQIDICINFARLYSSSVLKNILPEQRRTDELSHNSWDQRKGRRVPQQQLDERRHCLMSDNHKLGQQRFVAQIPYCSHPMNNNVQWQLLNIS